MPLTLEQLTVKTGAYQAPALSTHGYIVQPSGVVYALTQRYIHGLVLALLYPDRFDDYCRSQSDRVVSLPATIDDFSAIFALQHFEMTVTQQVSVIRICPSRLVGPTSIDLPSQPATVAQLHSVRSVFSALNLGPRAIVNTDLSDMTVSKCLQLAELSRQQRPQCFGEENRPSAGLNRNESYATRS